MKSILLSGEAATGNLLVLSQVVLSLQLPFAVIPLVHFVSDRRRMGEFAIGPRGLSDMIHRSTIEALRHRTRASVLAIPLGYLE